LTIFLATLLTILQRRDNITPVAYYYDVTIITEVIDMPDFGKALIAERSRRGLNQGDLAKLTECDIHTVIDIERGRVDITRNCFKEMVSAMDSREIAEATR